MATSLSRFRGSVVGGVIGDCLGAIFEGLWVPGINIENVLHMVNKVEDAHGKRGDASNSTGKRAKKIWNFTDDTAMARSVAASLIQNKKFDAKHMAKMFTDEFLRESDRGYGADVGIVFRALAECDYLDTYGPASRQFNGQGSYGNGGAMRISPAALFAHRQKYSFDQLKELVDGITRITHSHMDAINGSILQCYAVFVALNTEKLDINSYIDSLIKHIQPLEEAVLQKQQTSDTKESQDKKKDGETTVSDKHPAKKEEEETYTYKLEKIREYVLQEELPDVKEINRVLGTDVSAFRSVPTAVYAFLRATKNIPELEKQNGFERTIIYAISLGGDTDTIATMAGAIAGAYYGIEDIPLSWQAGCEGVDKALEYGRSLHDL